MGKVFGMAGHKITFIPGDGVGPEVTGAARKIIDATGIQIHWEVCEAGAAVFKKGLATGVPQETIDSLTCNRVALKGPLETPVGYGEKSANVTLRKMFEMFGNIRPVREFPNVPTPFSGRGIDFTIIRENVEDLYAGIEYMHTPGVAECLKLMSRKGCEKIVRLAFEYARSEGRKTVHCATKANIMKLTEGLMKKTFEDVALEYPEIQAKHIIVDNCAHQLVRLPEQFEVIVTSNMNGDILSDLGSGLIGGLGFAPGANVGNDIALFEAVHGSAPKYAGLNKINPTAVLLSGTMMLRYIGEFDTADLIENALLATLEDGCLTQDVNKTSSAVSTSEFTDQIIKNLGKRPSSQNVRQRNPLKVPQISHRADFIPTAEQNIVGVDIYMSFAQTAHDLGQILSELAHTSPFVLKAISNRGVKVYPNVPANPDCVDSWRCRFIAKSGSTNNEEIKALVSTIEQKVPWIQLRKLCDFNGVPGYSKDQGEG